MGDAGALVQLVLTFYPTGLEEGGLLAKMLIKSHLGSADSEALAMGRRGSWGAVRALH